MCQYVLCKHPVSPTGCSLSAAFLGSPLSPLLYREKSTAIGSWAFMSAQRRLLRLSGEPENRSAGSLNTQLHDSSQEDGFTLATHHCGRKRPPGWPMAISEFRLHLGVCELQIDQIIQNEH